jgi:hypothetical protein
LEVEGYRLKVGELGIGDWEVGQFTSSQFPIPNLPPPNKNARMREVIRAAGWEWN